jgi:hypothetical protein
MSEEAKAVQELAKVAGRSVEAVRDLGGFIARYIHGPLEQAAGIVHDKLAYLRWERQQRLMVRAEEFLRAEGLEQPTRAVPLKVAIPLLAAASIEDDDELQDLWAKLLVNAGNADSGVDVRRAFIDILQSITPFEAAILRTIYSVDFGAMRHVGVATHRLPEHVEILSHDNTEDPPAPSDEIELALANLARIGCVRSAMSWGGGELFNSVHPTALGRAFFRACTLMSDKKRC